MLDGRIEYDDFNGRMSLNVHIMHILFSFLARYYQDTCSVGSAGGASARTIHLALSRLSHASLHHAWKDRSRRSQRKLEHNVSVYDRRHCITFSLLSRASMMMLCLLLLLVLSNLGSALRQSLQCYDLSDQSGDEVRAVEYIAHLSYYNFNNRINSCCFTGINDNLKTSSEGLLYDDFQEYGSFMRTPAITSGPPGPVTGGAGATDTALMLPGHSSTPRPV